MSDSYIQTRINILANGYARGNIAATETTFLRTDLGLGTSEIIQLCGDVEDEFQISSFTSEQIADLDTPHSIYLWVLSKQKQPRNWGATLRMADHRLRAAA